MSAPFLLVRHGETDWNRRGLVQGRTDIPLNATGREQAASAARLLAQHAPSLIVSSPLSRARETAEIIADGLGLERIETDEDVAERDFGRGEGLSWPEIRQRFPDGLPGAEDRAVVVDRARQALLRWMPEAPGRIVVVTHGGVINALNRFAAERPEDYPGSAANCSINAFTLEKLRLARPVADAT